jgi:ABC-2 type transport system ATP-binding protein
MNMIETHNLTRRFGHTEAVHDLSFVVPVGSVCALLGPNGAGKSTTIRLLMNHLSPTAGEASVMSVDSRQLGPLEFAQIGYVADNQQLPLWMTVRQLLDYCRPFYPTWDVTLERTLLDRFALPENRRLRQLSRGMLMKASLISSLAYRPKLLLLDEPFSGLDVLVREDFVRGVLEVSAAGDWTVLVASHEIEEVERLADRVALLDGGRLCLSETTEALQARFRRVEVALPGDAMPPPSFPTSWLGLECAGSLVSFVDSRYDRDATERACRERFPEATVTARPMTLREIFVTLARSGSNLEKGFAE